MLYAVIPLGENDQLYQRLQKVADELYAQTGPHVYFLTYDGTSRALRDALGFGDLGGGGDGIVLRVTDSSGYTYRNLWEWLEERRR